MIATHGFVKKTRKAPAAEIERALAWRDAYFRDRQRGDIRIGGTGR